MFKKIYAYQKLAYRTGDYTYRSQNNTRPGLIVLFVVVFEVAHFLIEGFLQFRAMDFSWLLPWIVCVLALEYAVQFQRAPLSHTIPVSDHFRVANILFVLPLRMSIIVAAIIAVITALVTAVASYNPFFPSAGNGMLFPHCFVSGTIFAVLFMCGIWFWLAQATFRRNKWGRYLRYCLVFLFNVAFICVTSLLLFRQGYYNEHGLMELPELFSPIWMNVGAAVFAGGSGIFAWRHSLQLCRADLKGQRKAKSDINAAMTLIETPKAQTVAKKKTTLMPIVLALLSIVFVVVLYAALNGGFNKGMHFSVETQNISDYALWDANMQRTGIPEDLNYISSGLLIFPEQVDENTVEEYYARFSGKYGEGWASCSWTRFLVLQLPQEEYTAEKQRIANLSVTYQGQTNHVIRDTEHFPYEAYMAVLGGNSAENEYALFDDTRRQIIYVYDSGDKPQLGAIPTQQDYMIQTKVSPITVRQVNNDGNGYSIYSFCDTYGYTTVWWPGMQRFS